MNAEVCWEVGVKANFSRDGRESENFLLCTFQPNGTVKRHCCRLGTPFLCEKHQNYRLPTKIAATCDTTLVPLTPFTIVCSATIPQR